MSKILKYMIENKIIEDNDYKYFYTFNYKDFLNFELIKSSEWLNNEKYEFDYPFDYNKNIMKIEVKRKILENLTISIFEHLLFSSYYKEMEIYNDERTQYFIDDFMTNLDKNKEKIKLKKKLDDENLILSSILDGNTNFLKINEKINFLIINYRNGIISNNLYEIMEGLIYLMSEYNFDEKRKICDFIINEKKYPKKKIFKILNNILKNNRNKNTKFLNYYFDEYCKEKDKYFEGGIKKINNILSKYYEDEDEEVKINEKYFENKEVEDDFIINSINCEKQYNFIKKYLNFDEIIKNLVLKPRHIICSGCGGLINNKYIRNDKEFSEEKIIDILIKIERYDLLLEFVFDNNQQNIKIIFEDKKIIEIILEKIKKHEYNKWYKQFLELSYKVKPIYFTDKIKEECNKIKGLIKF